MILICLYYRFWTKQREKSLRNSLSFSRKRCFNKRRPRISATFKYALHRLLKTNKRCGGSRAEEWRWVWSVLLCFIGLYHCFESIRSAYRVLKYNFSYKFTFWKNGTAALHSTSPGSYYSYWCNGWFKHNLEWVRIDWIILVPPLSSIPTGRCLSMAKVWYTTRLFCLSKAESTRLDMIHCAVCYVKNWVDSIKTMLFQMYHQWLFLSVIRLFLFPSRRRTFSFMDCAYNAASGRWICGERTNSLRVFSFVKRNPELDSG